ncbi:MAG: hypothetical protein JWN94_3647 [Betaproteobacteria bacterium]|nr:hypothetical protein [Betaproteobacteria bacterium]
MAAFSSVERTIGWGFMASLFGMLALALVAYSVSKEEIESADWVASTEEIIGTLEEIQRAALDTESTARAYLISGDPELLNEYANLKPLISERIAEFRKLTGDNLTQQQRADDLLAAVHLRFVSMTRLMERRRVEGFNSVAGEAGIGKGREQMNAIKADIREMVAEQERILKLRKKTRDKSVHVVWATIAVMVVLGASMLTWIFYQTLVAVRQRQHAEERANHLAHHDALTGLPNRRLLQDRLAQAMTAATRHGHLLAIMYLDLDGFKTINDSLGHDIGDELLKEVAQRLLSTLRQEDTAVRLGGDEFVVGLMRLNQPADAEAAARKLIDALGKPYHLAGHDVVVTTSIGISVFPGNVKTSDELLKHADAALYKAKTAGKNRYCFSADKADVAEAVV